MRFIGFILSGFLLLCNHVHGQSADNLSLSISLAGNYDSIAFLDNRQPANINLMISNHGSDYVLLPADGFNWMRAEDFVVFLKRDGYETVSFEPKPRRDVISDTTHRVRAINPGEHKYIHFDPFYSTQYSHWEWWESIGFPEGEYSIWAEYCPEDNTELFSGCLFSDTVKFICREDVYNHLPRVHHRSVLKRDANNMPIRIGYFDKKGRISAERLYERNYYGSYYPVFQIEYDNPVISPVSWEWKDTVIYYGDNFGRIRIWRSDGDVFPNGTCHTFEYSYPRVFFQYKMRMINGRLSDDFNKDNVFGSFANGVPSGYWYSITTQGDTVMRCTYQQGVLEGPAFMVHGNYLRVTGNYKHGKLHGKQITTDGEGNLLTIETYDMGIMHGERTLFRVNGDTIVSGEYRYGEMYNGTFLPFRGSASGRGSSDVMVYRKGLRILPESLKP